MKKSVPVRRGPDWLRFKADLRRTWKQLEGADLDRFADDQGLLEEFIHERTRKDPEGIRLRVQKLIDDARIRF